MREESDGGRTPDADGTTEFERGNELLAAGELEQAERAYREADEQGHATAASYLGLIAQSRGETGVALEAYERADERGDGLGALRLGLLLAGANEWDEARNAFARADERGGDHRLPPQLAALLGGEQSAADAPAGTQRSPLANPVMIGAVTLLIVIVAVFLAFIANTGLPFVPTKELKVDIANGAELVVGNDVDEGGFRVGLVSAMRPIELPNGQEGAQLTLALDESHARVPADSMATILPRSVLGTKYVQLQLGSSSRLIADGGTLPISQTTVPVQIDDIFDMFNSKTRSAVQQDLVGFGDALTARGSSLNDTFASLPALFTYLQPVAQYLSDPNTELTRFLGALNQFTGAISPVAATNARLFTDMATTFQAISSDPNALEQTIAQSPPTLDVSTDSLKTQEPFLIDLAKLGTQLTPASASLSATLPVINPALEAGTRVLPRTPQLNNELDGVMHSLKNLALAPGTNVAINALTATVGTLNPMLKYLGPYQTVCDDWDYWWTYLADTVSEGTSFGTAQRALLNTADATQTDNVGSIGAAQPAGTDGGPEALHNPVYGAAIDDQGNADCETGQRGYPLKLDHSDYASRNLDMDQHTPGDQGPTYHGRTHVPAGETFSRNPTTGPQVPPDPANP
jgi:virulence factor Mce-like protein